MQVEPSSAAFGVVTPKAEQREGCPDLTTSKLLHLHPILKEDLQRELVAFICYGLCRLSSKKLWFAADLEKLSGPPEMRGTMPAQMGALG